MSYPHYYKYEVITPDTLVMERVTIISNNDYKASSRMRDYMQQFYGKLDCDFAYRYVREYW